MGLETVVRDIRANWKQLGYSLHAKNSANRFGGGKVIVEVYRKKLADGRITQQTLTIMKDRHGNVLNCKIGGSVYL